MEQTSRIEAEYLMTVYVPLKTPQKVTGSLHVYTSKPGGWVSGPKIKGEVVAPTADWLRVLPNGVKALDVRLSILADDGSYIFMQYLGRIAGPERIRMWPKPPAEARYFLINPVFETSSEKYGWLNDVVCVGKDITPLNTNEECAMYEIFVLR